jgi:hypothetical protein
MADAEDHPSDDEEEEEAIDPVVTFSLSPALADTSVINYNTTKGAKLYSAATQKLTTEYDLSPNGLKLFLTQLGARAMFGGWTDILNIPLIPGAEPEILINLISHYGMIKPHEVRRHAAMYYNTHTRVAQDTATLFVCIMNSLSPDAQNKISIREKDYTFTDGDTVYVSGTCLLKIVIDEACIDTNATTRRIREKLSDLPNYMVSVDSDIGEFNLYVKNLMINLGARGQTTHDLLPNLFKGYKAVADENFVAYIARKQDDYDDGIDTTDEELMSSAELKWKTMVAEKTWKSPNEDSSKIIALEAQIRSLSNKFNSQESPKNYAKRPAENRGGPPRKKKDRNADKPLWMTTPPAAGMPHSKTVDGKKGEWEWCPTHKAWGRHKHQVCELQLKGLRSKGLKPPKYGGKSNDDKTLKINQALAAIIKQEDDYSD